MVASFLPKRAFVGLIVYLLCGVCFAFRLQLIQTRLTSSGQQLGKFRGFEKALELSVEGNQVNTPISFAKIGTKSTKPRPAVRWTKPMDNQLFNEMKSTPRRPWKDIASSIGKGISAHQCVYRWDTHMKLKNIAKDNDAPWTEEEYALLTQLVAEGLSQKKRISWKSIGAQLNRVPLSCRIKWDTELYAPRGYFSTEEENLILETVRNATRVNEITETDSEEGSEQGTDVVRDRGLWAKLGKQLGRSDHVVRARYLALQCAFKTRMQWTDAMDAILTQLSKSAPSDAPDWKGVAAHMKEKGFQVTGTECRNRWHVYQKYIHKGMRSCADWTPDEVTKLITMRNNQSSWEEIGHALNVVPSVCCRKLQILRDAELKRGSFTPEEDACIRDYVKEWGDPKRQRGLWEKLKEVLKRPGIYIRQRWYCTLYHETGKRVSESA